jgi:hypothetical protein
MADKIKFTKAREDEWPMCPYCKKDLKEIKYKQRGWISTLTTFWCPQCRSLLGTSATFYG